jgi:hypothetical protein
MHFPSGAWTFEDKEKLSKMIQVSIDEGRNLEVSYIHNLEFLDKETGRMELPTDFDREKIRKEDAKTGHSALIEGYHLDDLGKMDWVLIKNSHGKNIYLHGHNEMSFDYLVEMGWKVSRISLIR